MPFLSTTSAHLLAGLFAFTYVGSIYTSKSARLRFSKRKVNLPEGQARLKLQTERWRDDPDVIKARLLAVSGATLICCLIVFIVMKNGNGDNAMVRDPFLWCRVSVVHGQQQQNLTPNAWLHLGFTWSNILPLLLTPLLYAGPLYVQFLEKTLPFQEDWDFEDDVLFRFFSIFGLRNYFVVSVRRVEYVACHLACVLTGSDYRRGCVSRLCSHYLSFGGSFPEENDFSQSLGLWRRYVIRVSV
jgi:prenyl protein peptidase